MIWHGRICPTENQTTTQIQDNLSSIEQHKWWLTKMSLLNWIIIVIHLIHFNHFTKFLCGRSENRFQIFPNNLSKKHRMCLLRYPKGSSKSRFAIFPDLPAKMGQARINQPACELLLAGFAVHGWLVVFVRTKNEATTFQPFHYAGAKPT